MMISPHFTLQELVYSLTAHELQITNVPSLDIGVQLVLLCNNTLEKIRALFDKPIVVSSGYRCSSLNAAVHGVPNSAHLYGCAADFTVPEFGNPLAVCEQVKSHLEDFEIDQLIHENGWVHVGRAPNWGDPRHEYFGITSTQLR